MFSYDSVAGSRPIGGDRSPRQQMQRLQGAQRPAYPFQKHYDLPNNYGQVRPDPARPYTPGFSGDQAIPNLLPYTGAHVYPRAGWTNNFGGGHGPRDNIDAVGNGQSSYDKLVNALGGYGGPHQSEPEDGDGLGGLIGSGGLLGVTDKVSLKNKRAAMAARPVPGPQPNRRFPMAPRYVGGQQQGDDYEQYAQAAGLRGTGGSLGLPAGPQQSAMMSPQARRAFVQNAHDNPNGAYQQFSRALAGERQGPYAGVSMNQMPSPMSSRDAFNQQYGSHLGTAMAAGRPGMGLLGNEAAAQMGGYQHMPNVTVGGAYGRGPAGQDNSYLYKLLGINGEGHAVPGGVTDPTTLGALRSRMKAPWMNGQQQMAQAGNPAAALGMDTTGTAQSTFDARTARAAASGGRLIPNPGPVARANSGNYNLSDSDGGIDAKAIVRQNPNAIYGFSADNQKKLAMDPGYQQDLKGRQLAYQMRQQQAISDQGDRQRAVADASKARSLARQDRMNGVTPEYKLQQQHLQNQNDMLAAQLGLQNRRLDQGDAELAQKGNQFKQQLRAQVAVKAAEAGLDEDQTQELMARLGMGDEGGNAQVAPGAKGGGRQLSKKEEEKLMTMDDPQQKRDYMKKILGMSDDEITARLQEGYTNENPSDYLWGALGRHSTPPTAKNPEGTWQSNWGIGPAGNGAIAGDAIYGLGKALGIPWEDIFRKKPLAKPTARK